MSSSLTGPLYPSLVLGLGVVDSRAVVSHFGSDNRNPTSAYTNTVWKSFNSGLKQGLDVASNVAFALGDLEAGAVADVRYVYSLRQEALDTALSTLFGLSIVSPSVAVSGDAAPFVVVADGATTRVDFYVIKDGTETQVLGAFSAWVFAVPVFSVCGTGRPHTHSSRTPFSPLRLLSPLNPPHPSPSTQCRCLSCVSPALLSPLSLQLGNSSAARYLLRNGQAVFSIVFNSTAVHAAGAKYVTFKAVASVSTYSNFDARVAQVVNYASGALKTTTLLSNGTVGSAVVTPAPDANYGFL